jgi:lupus La protein
MWTLYTANPDHWVPISTVASFKRMREFTPLGVEWVAKALRLNSELEVDETNTNVRRTTEIQEPKGQFDRSIYAVSVISNGAVMFITLCPERIWR